MRSPLAFRKRREHQRADAHIQSLIGQPGIDQEYLRNWLIYAAVGRDYLTMERARTVETKAREWAEKYGAFRR